MTVRKQPIKADLVGTNNETVQSIGYRVASPVGRSKLALSEATDYSPPQADGPTIRKLASSECHDRQE